jgi:quaternary ammonium compound-resistance protein SugE
MAWIYLIVAGLLEVVWSVALKQSQGFTRLLPSIISLIGMIASVGLLSISMRTLPLGTAYVAWTGIGAVGAFLAGIVMLGEPVNAQRVLAAGLILAGLVLMRNASA